MYREQPPLRSQPFQATIDTSLFFPGGGRREIVEDMATALCQSVPLLLLTGGDGIGKTMVCRMVEKELPADIVSVFLSRPIDSFNDMVTLVAREIGIDSGTEDGSTDTREILETIETTLRTRGQKLVVFFDEAEKIYLATLERIRKALDQVNEGGIVFQFVFSGQDQFEDNLKQLSIVTFEDAEERKFTLETLDEEASYQYLNQCMRIASGKDEEFFSSNLVSKIFAASNGNFKRLNYFAVESLQSDQLDTSFLSLIETHEHDSVSKSAEQLIERRSRVPKTTGEVNLDFLKFSRILPTWLLFGGGACASALLLFIWFNQGGGDDKSGETESDVPIIELKKVVPLNSSSFQTNNTPGVASTKLPVTSDLTIEEKLPEPVVNGATVPELILETSAAKRLPESDMPDIPDAAKTPVKTPDRLPEKLPEVVESEVEVVAPAEVETTVEPPVIAEKEQEMIDPASVIPPEAEVALTLEPPVIAEKEQVVVDPAVVIPPETEVALTLEPPVIAEKEQVVVDPAVVIPSEAEVALTIEPPVIAEKEQLVVDPAVVILPEAEVALTREPPVIAEKEQEMIDPASVIPPEAEVETTVEPPVIAEIEPQVIEPAVDPPVLVEKERADIVDSVDGQAEQTDDAFEEETTKVMVEPLEEKEEPFSAEAIKEPQLPDLPKLPETIIVIGDEKKYKLSKFPSQDAASKVTSEKPQFTELTDKGVDALFLKRIAAGARWLVGGGSGKYTIQLMVLTSYQAEESLKKMLKTIEYQEVASQLYVLRRTGPDPTVMVFYGEYPDLATARKGRNSLPVFLRKHHPYAISVYGAVEKATTPQ